MPRADLPSTPLGWFVALLSSFVGFILGFLTLSLLNNMFGGAGG